MTTETALIEKREELKRRLAAGEYKTLVDILFNGMGRTIQKVFRTSRPFSAWFSSLILFFIVILMQFAAQSIKGDVSNAMRLTALLPTIFVPLAILIGYSLVAGLVVGNIYIHRIFDTYQESVLDTSESIATVNKIEQWLTSVCNQKVHFLVSIIGGGLLGSYLNFLTSSVLRIALPSSAAVGTLLFSVCTSAFLYMLFYILVLTAQAGRYNLKLFVVDPGNSDVVIRLNHLFSSIVYLVSGYAAFLTLATSVIANRGFLQAGILIAVLFWIPIIAIFILNQSSLSTLIQRAKGKTLNEIQARIEELHNSEKLGEKEPMETINRLMDYYDRIKSIRSSRIDSGAVLNLINSLLLPLLALVLGNIDKILALFK